LIVPGNGSEANIWLRSAEGTELNEAVLSVLAHELGGIASALDLRAHALASTIPLRDSEALKTLAEELRLATRALRLVRSQDASGMLSPMREQTLAEWWRLASRLTRAVLPRGTVVDAAFTEARLPAGQSGHLTGIWLSACKDLAEKGVKTPASIALQGGPSDTGRGVTLIAETNAAVVATNGDASRWARHAAEIASELSAMAPFWKREGAVVRWTCTIPAAVD
jgi:hypothetical protein